MPAHKLGWSLLFAGAVTITPPVAGSSAAAEAQAPAQNGAVTTSDGAASSEIIVTATRRAERLENIPASIAVVSAAAIEASGVADIHNLGQLASGVQIDFAGAYTQPAIRGVTSLTNGAGADNNVAIYIDGFYQSNTQAIAQDLVNLDNIQVLKGPQGALYGRNATGGAILINTLKPSATWTGLGEITYARFDDKRARAYVSGPLSESIRFSIAGYFRRGDGYLGLADPAVYALNPNDPTITARGDAAPIKQRSVRTKLQADVTETLTATLAYNYAFSEDTRGLMFTTYDHRPSYLPPAPPRDQVAFNYDVSQPAQTNEGTLTLTWKTGIGTLSSYSGYTHVGVPQAFDFDGTYSDLSSVVSPSTQSTYQQTVDYAIDAVDRLDLVVGGSYIHDNVLGSVSFFSAARKPASVARQQLLSEAYAFYADGTFHLTDKLSLGAGGRYTHERKQAFYSSFLPSTGTFSFAPTTKRAAYSKFTPRASIRYEFVPRSSVYFAFSTGFRSGTYSAYGAPTPALWLPLRPETIKAYELGVKSVRGPLRVDLAGFYYDYTDIHVSVTAPNTNCPAGVTCGLLTLFQNAKGAEIYGLDGQLTLSPADKLNLRLGGTYLHSEYTDFPNATGIGLNAATNLNVTGQTQDWSGKPMARAPKLSGNLGGDYTAGFVGGNVTVAGNVRYTASYVVSNPSLFGSLAGALATRQRFRQRAFAQVNASLTWADADNHFSLGVFADNLTDKQYKLAYTGSVFGDYGPISEPRIYGVRAGYRF